MRPFGVVFFTVPGAKYFCFEQVTKDFSAERLKIHYTPEHGGWLNVAEIDQSVWARQALSRRIPSSPVFCVTRLAYQAGCSVGLGDSDFSS